jgi:hypothetical protein
MHFHTNFVIIIIFINDISGKILGTSCRLAESQNIIPPWFHCLQINPNFHLKRKFYQRKEVVCKKTDLNILQLSYACFSTLSILGPHLFTTAISGKILVTSHRLPESQNCTYSKF